MGAAVQTPIPGWGKPHSESRALTYRWSMEIDYPRFGVIVVEGTTYDHDVVIDEGKVRPRDKGPSKALKARHGHTPLSVAEDIPWSGRRLVIGSGYSGSLPVTGDLIEEGNRRGVELVVVPTAEACGLLADLDPSAVNAILHVTC